MTIVAVQMAGGSGGLVFLVQLVFFGAIIYFLLIRPQQRERKRHREMIAALKRGDEVITAGGLIGEIIQLRGRCRGAENRRVAGDGRARADRPGWWCRRRWVHERVRSMALLKNRTTGRAGAAQARGGDLRNRRGGSHPGGGHVRDDVPCRGNRFWQDPRSVFRGASW